MTNLSALSWRLVALVGLLLAAYVVLSVFGVDTSNLVTIVLGVAGFGGLGVHQATRSDKQDAALATITHQTNGILTQRIKNGVRAVLDERGITEPPPK